MADWATISSLATAGGTLVLAVATFASVRSSNRSAKLAELALMDQLRPVLLHSHFDDPAQKIGFAGGHWVRVEGGGAAVEHEDGVVYLAISVRNVGAGIAVPQGWHPWPEPASSQIHPAPEVFRATTRDLYVPPGGIGLWQGAIRDANEDIHATMAAVATERRPFALDLLYTDQHGGQRTVSRFGITPGSDDRWIAAVVRHWSLDRPGPRG